MVVAEHGLIRDEDHLGAVLLFCLLQGFIPDNLTGPELYLLALAFAERSDNE